MTELEYIEELRDQLTWWEVPSDTVRGFTLVDGILCMTQKNAPYPIRRLDKGHRQGTDCLVNQALDLHRGQVPRYQTHQRTIA